MVILLIIGLACLAWAFFGGKKDPSLDVPLIGSLVDIQYLDDSIASLSNTDTSTFTQEQKTAHDDKLASLMAFKKRYEYYITSYSIASENQAANGVVMSLTGIAILGVAGVGSFSS